MNELSIQKKENFFKFLNIEVYKLDEITTDKNFILYDKNKNIHYKGYNLLMVVDKIINEYPLKLLEYLDINITSKEKLTREFALEYIYKFHGQKEIFKFIKNEIMILKQHIDNIGFKPILDFVYEENNKKYFNIYVPKNKNIFDIEPKLNPDGFPHIKTILHNIVGGNDIIYDYHLKFLSWKAKNRTKKIHMAWLFQDSGGTGKTSFYGKEIIGRLWNVSIIGQEDLISPYTDWLINSEFVICEEIEGYENEKKIKYLTGTDSISINEKYGMKFTIKDYNAFVFFTNDIKSLKLSSENRRFIVAGGGKPLLKKPKGAWSETLFGNQEKSRKFIKDFYQNIDEEIIIFYAHLLALDVKEYEMWEIIDTDLTDKLTDLSKTSEELFLEDILDLGFVSVFKSYPSKNNLDKYILKKGRKTFVSKSCIYELYRNFCVTNGYKPLAQNHFYRRMVTHKIYEKVFGEELRLELNNTSERTRCLHLKNFNIISKKEEIEEIKF